MDELLDQITPLETLLELGANIIAVDLDRPGIWERADRVVAMVDGRVVDPVHVARAAEVGA